MMDNKNKFKKILAISFVIVCLIVIYTLQPAPKNLILSCDGRLGCYFAKISIHDKHSRHVFPLINIIKPTETFLPDEITKINCDNDDCYIIITSNSMHNKGYNYRKDITPKMYVELVKFLQAKQDNIYVNENINPGWVVLVILIIVIVLRFC